MAAVRSGRCLCGAIEVGLESEPLVIGICHCRHCQATGGTAFSVVGFLPIAAVHVRGTPRSIAAQAAGGAEVRRDFCGECGSPIATRTAALDAQGLQVVKLGLFEDVGSFLPTVEVFCDRRVPWLPPLRATATFAAMPPASE